MDQFEVDKPSCRIRQQRLLAEMHQKNLELVILTHGPSVQWLTGAYLGPLLTTAAALDINGHVTLVLPERKLSTAATADKLVGYEAAWHSTMRNDQRAACTESLLEALKPGGADSKHPRVAGEWSCLSPTLIEALGPQLADIEPTLFQLRRRKESDELRMLTRAAEANRAMYARARELVRPGVNELDLYSQLQTTAVRELGEALTYFGQDFQSNSRGGPARDRAAQAGELYILDLGVGFRGYYSDNARTLSVDGHPTDDQLKAWEQLAAVFPWIEQTVRPGISCRDTFQQVQERLDTCQPWEFNHHLGHGVGLNPHEGPHLNPHWDDHFAEGDFFTVEPGLYHDQLRHGIRLEQNYLVTANGVQLLTDSPLEL
ncbi:MAG: Xaa-Pro peptidase family protein [Pirellulales bacterium]